MTNKNKTVISLAVILIIGISVAYASNTKTFQGFMRTRDGGERSQQQSGAGDGSGSGGGSTSESTDMKWWCEKIAEGEYGGSTDTVPTEETESNGQGSENTSTDPGQEEIPGTQESDSKNTIIIINPDTFRKAIFEKFKVIIPIYGSGQSTVVPNIPGNTPGGNDRTPKPPKEKPKPDKVIIEYECSCNATTFTLPELTVATFKCPDTEMQNKLLTVSETITSEGKEYEVIATKPPTGTCQEEFKENEKMNIFHQCGCDENEFFVEETGETLECPKGGEFKLDNEKNYEIWSYKSEKYECDPQWKCPNNKYNWQKINDDCKQLKEDKCSGNTVDAHVESACGAFKESMMNAECGTEEDCEKTQESWLNGDEAAGLPSIGNYCESQL